MSASLHVPRTIKAKTTEELIQQLLVVQDQEHAKVSIISIIQDVTTKEWVLFYYPARNLGGGLM
jgi:hypothetical protein